MKWKYYDYENSCITVENNYGKVTYYDEDFNKIESKCEEKDLKTF